MHRKRRKKSVKQIAAARRNIKKALAALLKKKRPKPLKRKFKIKNILRNPFRKRRAKSHKKSQTNRGIPFDALAVNAYALGNIVGIGNPRDIGPPQQPPPPPPGNLTIVASYLGVISTGEQRVQVSGGGYTKNNAVYLYVSDDRDSTNNQRFGINTDGNGIFGNTIAYTPRNYSHILTMYAVDQATNNRSNTINLTIPAVSAGSNPTFSLFPGVISLASFGGFNAINLRLTGTGFTADGGINFMIYAPTGPGVLISTDSFSGTGHMIDANGNLSFNYPLTIAQYQSFKSANYSKVTIQLLDKQTNSRSNSVDLQIV
jgi:hypothetical protein